MAPPGVGDLCVETRRGGWGLPFRRQVSLLRQWQASLSDHLRGRIRPGQDLALFRGGRARTWPVQ